MADRFFSHDEETAQIGRVVLDIEFVAGSSGAVPTALSGYVRSMGIDSMSLAATGLYTVNLTDNYTGIAQASFRVQQASYDATHARMGDVTVNSVSDATTPLVTFQ